MNEKTSKKCIVFKQVGCFYEAYGNDALLLNQKANYKLVDVKNIPQVGFPIVGFDTSLERVNAICVDYDIIDNNGQIVVSKRFDNNKYEIIDSNYVENNDCLEIKNNEKPLREEYDIADVINELIKGVNIYTGEAITGLDANIKNDLTALYNLFAINKDRRINKKKTNDLKQECNANIQEDKKEQPREINVAKVQENTKEHELSKKVSPKEAYNIRRGNIEVDGNKYYLYEGKLADKTGRSLPEGTAISILNKYYRSFDTGFYSEEEWKEYVKGIKEANLWKLCVDVIELEFVNEHNGDFIRSVLPIYSSALRKMKKSNRVVEFWEKNSVSYSKYGSPEFFTSLAAAYCDIGDYLNAKQFANRALASGGSSGELTNVYSRIKARK